MSKRFLTPLGLLSATSDPVSASTGDIYFNSSSNVTRVYYGSAWVNLSASSTLATHANTASAIAGSLVTGVVASATVATTSGHANTASAINALLLTGTTLPAAIVSSSLTGVGTLANLTVTNTISGRAASATVATHAGTASSIAGSLVTGTVASATISASSNVTASINAGGITSGVLSVARGGTGVTSSTGTGSVVLTNDPVWTTGNLFTGAVNTTISATAGVYAFSVSPGTTLTGCVITNRSGGTVNRVHSAQVNVALNGTTASNGFVRGYVETNGGAAVAAAGNVFLYYIAW
jgi:hypothetical protein